MSDDTTWEPDEPWVPPLQDGMTLPTKLCWAGPTYSHPPHVWTEDKPGGKTYWCKGASTDRT